MSGFDNKTKNAGIVNPNSSIGDRIQQQHAIWLRQTIVKQEVGSKSSLKVNDGISVMIDTQELKTSAKDWKLTEAQETDLRDWAVAHELLHKLTIEHPPDRTLKFVADLATDDLPADLDTFSTLKNGHFFADYWSPAVVSGNVVAVLEPPAPKEVGGLNANLVDLEKGSALALLDVNKTISRHDEAHRAILRAYKTDISTKDAFPQGNALFAYSHSGRLNDHVPELKKLQETLAPDQKKLPDLKK